MKSIQNQHIQVNKKRILVAVIILVAILALVIFFSFFFRKTNNTTSGDSLPPPQTTKVNNINLDAPTNDQIKAGNSTKETTVNNSTNTPTQSTAEFTIAITAASQNNDIVQIRSLVDAVSNSGTCELTLSQGNKSVTKSSGTQALANSSTCRGFDIPTSELGTGDWTITLKVTMGAHTSSVTQKISVS